MQRAVVEAVLSEKSEGQLAGWAKPVDSHQQHFFLGTDEELMLESVCTAFYGVPWLVEPSVPLDLSRGLHAEGNCLGCRAWLSLPMNRRQLELKSTSPEPVSRC